MKKNILLVLIIFAMLLVIAALAAPAVYAGRYEASHDTL